MKRFWSLSRLTIEEAGERLSREFRSTDPEFDCENLYEWFEITSPDGMRLNVSRKHVGGEPDFDEPVCISAYGGPNVNDLGRRLAVCLTSTVYYGEVSYLGGDEYRFVEETRFEPNA